VTWGITSNGGKSSSVAKRLRSGVRQIFSSHRAFAALKEDGSVVTWGSSDSGGDSSAVATRLRSNVRQIFSTDLAFAALKSDGSVVTWGLSNYGGDSSAVSQMLTNVVAFADPFTDDQLVISASPASTYAIDRLNSDGSEDSRHTFRITRTGNIASAGAVRFTSASGTATSGSDFEPFTRTISFNPGQSTRDIYIDSLVDAVNEGTERFNASISRVYSADTIETGSTFGQIFNVPTGCTYSLARLNSDDLEGARHTFRITRSGDIADSGSVRFSTTGQTATSGVDFLPFSRELSFSPGQSSRDVYVDSLADSTSEGTERFIASIAAVASNDRIATASTFGDIFDDTSSPRRSIDLDSSSTQQLNFIWGLGGNGANPISYSRFLGLANRGFAVYDSKDQLPGPYQLAGDYKSPEFFDTAIGVGLAGSIRSGLNLDLTARAGSARLALNDNISLSWTRRNGAITLSSDYSYKPSNMKVNGPKLSALIDGRTDTTLAAYLNYKPPAASAWQKTGNLLGSSYNKSIPFYSRGFSSEASSTLASFGTGSSLEFQGINLDSESSTQITRGVSSRVEDPLLRATLDLDRSWPPPCLYRQDCHTKSAKSWGRSASTPSFRLPISP
jgi:hypothetical protein